MTPILIAHRGLLLGPDITLENKPEQLVKDLTLGFDCEVDIWYIYDKIFLGHDQPQYEVDFEFLNNNKFWIHAKNLDALFWLTTTDLNYFWHQNDDFVLTSHNIIWTLPGQHLTRKSIDVLPEIKDPKLENLHFNSLGICSDYVQLIREKYHWKYSVK